MAVGGGGLELKGFEDLQHTLKAIGDRAAAKHSRKAVTKAAVVLRREMRSRAPKRTGRLRKSIGYSIERVRGRQEGYIATVGIMNRRGVHGRFIEKGTKAHAIEPKKKGGKKALKIGQLYFRRVHRNRGITADPFLEPAYNAKQNQAVQAMADELRRLIEAEATK